MSDFLFEPVPHQEAVDFISGKTLVSREVFAELLPELRARAFTIAGVTSFDVLQRVREELATLPAGGDWEKVKRTVVEEIHPYLADPEDPENTEASERRAETLLRTHGFQAYSAASYRVMDRQRDVFPYWQYHSMGDGHVRPSHGALNRLVLPANSPFWKGHFPPWEWGCRCQVIPLMQEEVDAMKEQEADQPVEKREVIEGVPLRQLEDHNRLTRGPDQVWDVRTPAQKGDHKGLRWDPDDLRITPQMLEGRYDPVVWATFEKWARGTALGGTSKLTVWEWMSGKAVVGPEAPVALPPKHTETIGEIWHRLGLGKKVTWEESDVHSIKSALVKADPINPATKLLSVFGNGLLKKGVGSESWVKSQFAEILSFLPKVVAEALPPLRIEISNTIGGGFGDYDPQAKVVRVARKACLASVGGEGQFHETLWHEIMHWIHMHGPESYRKAIAEHFAERTKGQRIGRLPGYASQGKEDHWYDVYAGRVYGGNLDTPSGSGIEVPTKYFQLLNNPGKMLRERHPLKVNSAYLDETLRIVLSIFTGEHLA